VFELREAVEAIHHAQKPGVMKVLLRSQASDSIEGAGPAGSSRIPKGRKMTGELIHESAQRRASASRKIG
jgi:hypothetical protein